MYFALFSILFLSCILYFFISHLFHLIPFSLPSYSSASFIPFCSIFWYYTSFFIESLLNSFSLSVFYCLFILEFLISLFTFSCYPFFIFTAFHDFLSSFSFLLFPSFTSTFFLYYTVCLFCPCIFYSYLHWTSIAHRSFSIYPLMSSISSFNQFSFFL